MLFNIISCQNPQPEKIVKQFVIDLFDSTITPQGLIDKYIETVGEQKTNLSVSERKQMAVEIIDKARNGESKDLGWLIPNIEIKNFKNIDIYPYNKYKNLRTFNISGIENIKDRVYVLLDPNKENILQYFLLNEKGDKIISFSLFIQGTGSDAAFFGF